MLKIFTNPASKYAYLRTPKRANDLTYVWGEWVGEEYQNEETFEICTL